MITLSAEAQRGYGSDYIRWAMHVVWHQLPTLPPISTFQAFVAAYTAINLRWGGIPPFWNDVFYFWSLRSSTRETSADIASGFFAWAASTGPSAYRALGAGARCCRWTWRCGVGRKRHLCSIGHVEFARQKMAESHLWAMDRCIALLSFSLYRYSWAGTDRWRAGV